MFHFSFYVLVRVAFSPHLYLCFLGYSSQFQSVAAHFPLTPFPASNPAAALLPFLLLLLATTIFHRTHTRIDNPHLSQSCTTASLPCTQPLVFLS